MKISLSVVWSIENDLREIQQAENDRGEDVVIVDINKFFEKILLALEWWETVTIAKSNSCADQTLQKSGIPERENHHQRILTEI